MSATVEEHELSEHALPEAMRILDKMTKAPIFRTLLAQDIAKRAGLGAAYLDALAAERKEREQKHEPHEPRGPQLPAYARPILELRRRGMIPSRSVHVIVDDWKLGEPFLRVVVKPEQKEDNIDFSFLAGLSVIVVWSTIKSPFARVSAIIRAIMRSNPNFLYVMNMDNSESDFMVKSFKNGVELPEYAA